MPRLTTNLMCSFAERGYVVVSDAVSKPLIEAALAEVDHLVRQNPPPAGHCGFHFYWEARSRETDPLVALLQGSGAIELANSLIAPLGFEKPGQIQVSLNIPVWRHRPGGPHIDGLRTTEPDGRPGTFTLLVGIFLTDQTATDMGNLWVWPGSHHVGAAYLRAHGPDAIFDIEHPTYPMAAPEQVTGRAGDLFLGHYLLGHNMGGNTSEETRRVVYFRLHASGHRSRWRECLQDPLLEFGPVRLAQHGS